MTKLKQQARSISDRLSKIAKNLNLPYKLILTEFIIERLAVRLVAEKSLSHALVFKGGYVSLRVYQSPRYTVDLDALLRNGKLSKAVVDAKLAAQTDIRDGVWFLPERDFSLETQGEYGGHRIVFRTGIGEVLSDVRKAQIINLDIGTGDPIVPTERTIKTPYLLGNGELSWTVYPVETTVTEKLHALIVRGSLSSRSKDIFDLVLLIPKCNVDDLRKALIETFRYRGESMPDNFAETVRNIDGDLLSKG